MKRALATRAKPVDEKVGIEGEGFTDPKPLHDGECGAIDKTEGLVRVCLNDAPCSLEIGLFSSQDGSAGFA